MKHSFVILITFLSFNAFAADMMLTGMIPGMGNYNKNIQSIREQKFEYVVQQRTDFSCGAASLASILKYGYGNQTITEEEVLLGMLKVSDIELVQQQGFSLLDMKRYLNSQNMRGRGYRVGIKELQQLKIPAIVLLNDGGYSHFVVMRRFTGNQVYLGDPALGNRILSFDEFTDKWNGIVFVVIGNQYIKDNPLLQPRPQLTYKLLDPLQPLSDAELLEFGFEYADML
ncbi:C39 family peptidase [Shewanella pneumatophori]|uniref:C39 family peptidase n=1 Tax=Shewanella pneumatophori TaxID=314092 RepID=A0A9X1ZCZ6_9GAMM|nr:C39 family peptidase [Shewanella pneumatophori]MCL1139964.1 C39 family peptidase [Shewanella pneumatophori]